MERFAKSIVAGGLTLIAGLWIATLLERGSPWWAVGVALAALGTIALAAGIRSEVEY